MDSVESPRKSSEMPAAAAELRAVGYALARIRPGEKSPTRPRWPLLSEPPEDFTDDDGIGLVCGSSSGGLVCIDIDCHSADVDAWEAAERFLPETGMIDGRPGKPKSHYWYRIADTDFPDESLPKTGIVRDEMDAGRMPRFPGIRHFTNADSGRGIDVIGAGGQAVVPPSLHHSGSRREWFGDEREEPARVTWAELSAAVHALAAELGLRGGGDRVRPPEVTPEVVASIDQNRVKIRLAAYLDQTPTHAHRCGQGFHSQQWRVACVCAELGAALETAWPLYRAWNQRSTTVDDDAVLRETLERAYSFAVFGSKCVGKSADGKTAQSADESESVLPGIGICDLSSFDPEHDPDALIGASRYICRGGLFLISGQSGLGKSSLIAQLCVGWSCGIAVLGIAVIGPLRILVIQAENDRGDVAEQLRGTINGLGLTDRIDQVNRNLRYLTEAGTTGQGLADYLTPVMDRYRPDLLILDPLLAFLGGDANEQVAVSGFLRGVLVPMAQQYRCAIGIVHHTTKPRQGTAQRGTYAGAGSAELENVPRATLALLAGDEPGRAQLVAAKRGARLGWRDVSGAPVYALDLRHARFGICWEVADQTVARRAPDDSDLLRYLADAPGPHTARSVQAGLGLRSPRTLTRMADSLRGKGYLKAGQYALTPKGVSAAAEEVELIGEDSAVSPVGWNRKRNSVPGKNAEAEQTEKTVCSSGTASGTPPECSAVPPTQRVERNGTEQGTGTESAFDDEPTARCRGVP